MTNARFLARASRRTQHPLTIALLCALLLALTPLPGLAYPPVAAQAGRTALGGDDPPELDPASANLVITRLDVNANPAGAGVVVEVEIQNNGAAAVTDEFYIDLYINPPQPVTTGGSDWTTVGSTLVPVQGIEWGLTGLAAGQSVVLTSLPASDTAITPIAEYTTWSGQLPETVTDIYAYVDSYANNGSANGLVREANETDNSRHLARNGTPPPTLQGTFLPLVAAAAPPPPVDQFEASIAFRTDPHGYPFANWGGNSYDDSSDLDAATLIRMFGAGNVCHSGSTAQDCTLSAAAQEWRNKMLEFVRGGHCYGMASSTLRFFTGLDAAGNYQAGANRAHDLQAEPIVRGLITEMAITQFLRPADGSSAQFIVDQGKKPSEYLDLIRQRFLTNPTDPYVLGFFQQGKGGHAVTPYAIENQGNNIYLLHVYDNNWPDQPRYLTFNLNSETWEYNFAALNPGVEPDVWRGDARTDSLMLRPTSAHLFSGWACPFCQNSGVQGALVQNDQVEFQLLGEGQLLIIDAQGQGIGYEFTGQQFINEIAGAEIVEDYGGLGIEVPPLYRLPQETSLTPYTVYVAGQTITQTVDADLLMSGPGFAVGLEFIQISPGADLLMTIRPDGRQITFNASEEGTFGPDIFLALDPDPNGDSYIFDVGGFELESFKTVTVTLDLDNGLLRFNDDDGVADTYALNVLRIGADGTEEYFANDGIVLGGESNAAMNFASWDGSGAMVVTIDGADQSFPNEYPSAGANRREDG